MTGVGHIEEEPLHQLAENGHHLLVQNDADFHGNTEALQIGNALAGFRKSAFRLHNEIVNFRHRGVKRYPEIKVLQIALGNCFSVLEILQATHVGQNLNLALRGLLRQFLKHMNESIADHGRLTARDTQG